MLYTELRLSHFSVLQHNILYFYLAKCIQNLAYNAHPKSQHTKIRNKIYKGPSLQGVILSRGHILYMGRDMSQKRDGAQHMVTL